MESKWRAKLDGLLEEKNTLHNTITTLRERVGEFSGNLQTPIGKTAKTHTANQDFSESIQISTAKTAETPSEAERLGLVATWSAGGGSPGPMELWGVRLVLRVASVRLFAIVDFGLFE